jgi:hypothetical protein
VVDFSQIIEGLSAISSIAVIAGAGFVIVQLRLNSALLKATLRQEKKDAAFSMLQKLTEESFARRRANFYKVIEKRKTGDWTGFDDSEEDIEVRDFAYIYELFGQMVKHEVIEYSMVAEMLQYMVVDDWREFQAVSEHFMKRFGTRVSPWREFQLLAQRSERYMSEKRASRD